MAKVNVKNAPNTGDLIPNDYTMYSSWISYWESLKDKTIMRDDSDECYYCPKCNTRTLWKDFVGAHVKKEKGSLLYIVPTCGSCNSEKDTESAFEVDDSWLIPMPTQKRK